MMSRFITRTGDGAHPRQRCAHHALDEHVLRVRERVAVRVEDVRVEQVERLRGERVGHPRQNPRIQLRVGVVVRQSVPGAVASGHV